MTQKAFHLDLNRCTGCSACAIACRIENDLPITTTWRRVHTFNPSRFPQAALFHYSLACNHCVDPACLAGCPALVYEKDPSTGAVRLREERCIGCRYCSWVCPYDAPQFDRIAGTMSKCTFCLPRLEEGSEPACTAACPVDALAFVRVAELRTIDAPGFPEVGIQPALQITHKRRDYRAPAIVGATGGESSARPTPHSSSRGAGTWAGIRTEWPLLIFSFLAVCLVAWFTAATALSNSLPALPFAVLGALAMAASALHLGRRRRIPRSILNLRRSWVSREVAFFLLFYGSACTLGFLGVVPRPASWFVVLVGFGALFCMDMVYRVRGQRIAAVPHSAMATLTALLVLGLLLRNPVLVLSAGVIKLVLYAARVSCAARSSRAVAGLRIGFGFLLPAAVLIVGRDFGSALILGSVLVGELIDRAQFYAELEFLSPSSQLQTDLLRIAGRTPSGIVSRGLAGASNR